MRQRRVCKDGSRVAPRHAQRDDVMRLDGSNPVRSSSQARGFDGMDRSGRAVTSRQDEISNDGFLLQVQKLSYGRQTYGIAADPGAGASNGLVGGIVLRS